MNYHIIGLNGSGRLTVALMVMALCQLQAQDTRAIEKGASQQSSNTLNLEPRQVEAMALNELIGLDDAIELNHPNHSARFSAGGMQFTPRHGPQWQWTLTRVATTEGPVSGVVTGEITPRETANGTIDYPRGEIIERYVPRANTVEQQFVIPESLGLAADLVIAGEVSCAGEFSATRQGWTWRDAQGEVALGDVTVYDAQGRTLEARMEVAAARTRIIVSAADLMAADYPVTIDPEVGSNDFRISNMGPDGDDAYDASDPKVAYNSTDNEYLVVWRADDDTGSLVNNEFEIFGQLIDGATGAEIGSDIRISDMGPDGNGSYDAVAPAVAYNATNNLYLVVWEGEDDTAPLVDGESEIFGQLLTAAGSETGTNDFRISDMGTDGDTTRDALEPEVAWNATDNEFIVAWRGDDDDEWEIFGQLIDGATGAEIGSDIRISDMGATDGGFIFQASNADVAYNATNNLYLVVWDGDDDTGSLVDQEYEIFGQLLTAAGAETGTNDFRISDMGPDADPNYKAYNPYVAWNSTDNEFLVVWEGEDNTGSLIDNEYEIYGQRISDAGAEVGGDLRLSDMGATDGSASFDAYSPRVSYNATDNVYLVVWHGDDDTAPQVDIEMEVFFQVVAGATGAEVGPDERISDMGTDGDFASGAFYPDAAWNSTDNEFLVVWKGDEDVAPLIDGESEIFGQRLDGAAVPIKVSGYLVD